MSQEKARPTSDQEWTIHVLNIHGIFFERWCQQTIQSTPGFRVVSTNHPVEFPPPQNGICGKESALDIRAEHQNYLRLLTLVIECKKNNPEYVNWIFFPSQSPHSLNRITVPVIQNKALEDNPTGWQVVTGLSNTYFQDFPFTDEARETRGAYQTTSDQRNDRTKTKTSNAAISEAAYQVALATQSVLHDEIEKSSNQSNSINLMRWNMQAIIPIIVTSANLFTCNFDPSDVDPNTGEIPFDRAELTSHPYLVYAYPLPRHLQYLPSYTVTYLTPQMLELYKRMQIIVVHSSKLTDFLTKIVYGADFFFL